MKVITKSNCQDVFNEMSQKLKTVSGYKISLNQVFEYAIEKEIITKNPMAGVKVPKKERILL